MPSQTTTSRRIPDALAAFNSLPDVALIEDKVVAGLFGCSVTTVWRRARTGALPKPVKVSAHQTRWRVGAIRQALTDLVSA